MAAVDYAIKLRPNMTVLDFGCGVGRLMVPLADFLREGRCVGIDIVPGMIDFCKQQIETSFPGSKFYLSNSGKSTV